jgi:hypothetical protein
VLLVHLLKRLGLGDFSAVRTPPTEDLAEKVRAFLGAGHVGDDTETAVRLLDALDQPLSGMDDPDQVAAVRLGGALGLDTPDTGALLHALRPKEAR